MPTFVVPDSLPGETPVGEVVMRPAPAPTAGQSPPVVRLAPDGERDAREGRPAPRY